MTQSVDLTININTLLNEMRERQKNLKKALDDTLNSSVCGEEKHVRIENKTNPSSLRINNFTQRLNRIRKVRKDIDDIKFFVIPKSCLANLDDVVFFFLSCFDNSNLRSLKCS